MKISILPAAGIDAASARIRAFYLCEALVAKGEEAAIKVMDDADVLFIQKRITDDILLYAHHVRNRGGIVIYDLDDSGKRALDWLNIRPNQWQDMLALADAFTTNTAARRDLILQDFPQARVHLLPDSIDYCPPAPYRSQPEADERLKVLWFGHVSNLDLIAPYIDTLRSLDLDFNIATNPEAVSQLRAALPGINTIPWTLESFPTILRACDLAFLVHQGDAHDQAKSNNKMLASIANGVVPIVSDTPEYAGLAREIGAADSVYSCPEELARAIQCYAGHDGRSAYLDRAQPLVFERYGPNAVAQAFLDLVADLSQQKREKTQGNARGSNLLGNLTYAAKPLPSDASMEKIRSALLAAGCSTVVEVACHPGSLLPHLANSFQATGCDPSPVDAFPEDIRRLPLVQYDIFSTNLAFPTHHRGGCDGVLWYFAGCTATSLAQVAQAMNNMLLLANKKIVVVDSPEICEAMQSLTNSVKFEFIPVSIGKP